MLYEALMLLNRTRFMDDSKKETDSNEAVNANRYIDGFRSLVEEHYKEEHGVVFYADRLFITTNLTGEQLLDRYGGRVVDRLKQMCVPVRMTGNSKRKWL